MKLVIDYIIRQYDFNLVYAKKLVADLSAEQMTTKPATGLENHPAFTLGHLVTGSALIFEDLGGKMDVPEVWRELFIRKGPGDPRLPTDDSSLYPSRELLLGELHRQHEIVKNRMLEIPESQWHENIKWRFSAHMPTVADLCIFMCINHESMHLGQLAAWRRAMNLPSALGELK